MTTRFHGSHSRIGERRKGGIPSGTKDVHTATICSAERGDRIYCSRLYSLGPVQPQNVERIFSAACDRTSGTNLFTGLPWFRSSRRQRRSPHAHARKPPPTQPPEVEIRRVHAWAEGGFDRRAGGTVTRTPLPATSHGRSSPPPSHPHWDREDHGSEPFFVETEEEVARDQPSRVYKRQTLTNFPSTEPGESPA